MKNSILLFLIILTTAVQGQLEDCSSCDTITYTSQDIVKNTLHDLQLLRNEIFARHQYVFKDERLLEHFQEYLWYQPDHNNPAELSLNAVENTNIALFRKGEERIKRQRKRLFSELKELNRVLKQRDTITVNLFMNGALDKPANLGGAIKELNTIFSKIDLKDVNWYKDTAIYKISVDNGFLVRETELRIDGDQITVSIRDLKHSEIMTEPFQYGSNYHSEDEYSSIWIFKFDGKQLRLERHVIAG